MARTGYTDYNRTVDWDGPVLLEKVGVKEKGVLTFGKFDVSKYGYLGGRLGVEGKPVQVTIIWRASNEVGALITGERSLTFNPGVTQPGQFRIPNQGPWVEILMNAEGGAEFTLNAAIFATNRYSPSECFPLQPLLCNGEPTVEPKGGQKDVFPQFYWAGPLRVKAFSTLATWVIFLQAEEGIGNFVVVDVMNGTANNNVIWDTIAPLGSWKLTAINTAEASGKISVIAQPSVTGST